MKTSLFLGLTLLVGAATPSFGVTTMQLFLDAGGGNSCTFTVDSSGGGTVTPSGTCGGLTATLIGGANGELDVHGVLGNFSSTTTAALGHVANTSPTLVDLSTTEVTALVGAGTFTTRFTDRFNVLAADSFDTSVSYNNNQLAASSISLTSLYSASNSVPPGTVLNSFTFSNAGKNLGKSGSGNGNTINLTPFSIPYSLGGLSSVAFTGKGTINTSIQISGNASVPEPASIVLMGSMLLLTGIGLRRRRLSRG